jgi:predicted house-cleaning noncanonical NTP pyrophosphatase (MazG superfamily)
LNKVVHNKLVRDRIPKIIAADGKQANTRILGDKEYLKELVKKLGEEAKELQKDLSVEELADIKELVIAIREALGVHAGELEEVRRQKAAQRGRFKKKIFLESVEQ